MKNFDLEVTSLEENTISLNPGGNNDLGDDDTGGDGSSSSDDPKTK